MSLVTRLSRSPRAWRSNASSTPPGSAILYRRAHRHCATRQGENSVHVLSAAVAQAFGRSAWQSVQGSGMFSASAADGVMNLNVWLRTLTVPIVCAIFGMWQATH